jgi:hypothetical protein
MYAGQTTPEVSLAECILQMTAMAREARAKREQQLKATGITDPDVDWTSVRAGLDEANEAWKKSDAAKLRERLRAVHDRLPIPSDEIKAPDLEMMTSIASIRIVLVAMSELEKRKLDSRMATLVLDAQRLFKVEEEKRDLEAIAAVDAALYDAQRDYVRLSLKRISGVTVRRDGQLLEAIEPVDSLAVDALNRAGVFGLFFNVAQHFQSLSPEKAERFGLSAQST